MVVKGSDLNSRGTALGAGSSESVAEVCSESAEANSEKA